MLLSIYCSMSGLAKGDSTRTGDLRKSWEYIGIGPDIYGNVGISGVLGVGAYASFIGTGKIYKVVQLSVDINRGVQGSLNLYGLSMSATYIRKSVQFGTEISLYSTSISSISADVTTVTPYVGYVNWFFSVSGGYTFVVSGYDGNSFKPTPVVRIALRMKELTVMMHEWF